MLPSVDRPESQAVQARTVVLDSRFRGNDDGGADRPDFQATQARFTGFIRDPEHAAPPEDVEPRRLAIYRRLLFRNVENFMAGYYPVIKRILSDEQWAALLRDYFKTHAARTPLFPRMPHEFARYLAAPRPGVNDVYPFLAELAHYEWLEAALLTDSREIDAAAADPDGDLLDGTPVANPVAVLAQYRYPVHRIAPEYLPSAPPQEATYLVVYRNRADEARFLALNPVSARLLELIQADAGHSGRRMLAMIAAELRHPRPQAVIDGGLATLRELREKEVLLGVRPRGDKRRPT